MRTFFGLSGPGTSGGFLLSHRRCIPTLFCPALCTKHIGYLSGPGGKILASVHMRAAQGNGEGLDHEDFKHYLQ